MKEQASIRLIRLASSRPAKVLLQKTSAMIGRNPQKNFPRLIDIGIRMSPKPYHDAMYKVRDAFLQKPAGMAEDVFTPEVADGLDNLALRWKEASDPLWQARHPSFQPEPIPEPIERVKALAEVTT